MLVFDNLIVRGLLFRTLLFVILQTLGFTVAFHLVFFIFRGVLLRLWFVLFVLSNASSWGLFEGFDCRRVRNVGTHDLLVDDNFSVLKKEGVLASNGVVDRFPEEYCVGVQKLSEHRSFSFSFKIINEMNIFELLLEAKQSHQFKHLCTPLPGVSSMDLQSISETTICV